MPVPYGRSVWLYVSDAGIRNGLLRLMQMDIGYYIKLRLGQTGSVVSNVGHG